MPYDEDLAQRIRGLIPDDAAATEKRMFGGLAFLVGGHMAVAASGQGGLMVRVAPQDGDALLDEPGVEPMLMRGRPVDGWLRVATDAVSEDAALATWVDRGVGYARTLPEKT